jgi:hypothetical protein
MFSYNRRPIRAAALLLLTLMSAVQSHNSANARPVAEVVAKAAPSIAYFPPEVRLRRIHLVRPDLIPYPIQYSIVC